jgi:hypothetical protein
VQVGSAVNSVCLEARYLDRSKSGPVNSDIYQGLDLETVGIDINPVQTIGPHPYITVRCVGATRAEQQTNEQTDTTVAHATKVGDVGGASARAEPATFGEIRTRQQRVPERPYFSAVHGTVGVQGNQNVSLRRVESGSHRGPFSGLLLVNYAYIRPQRSSDSFGVVVRTAIHDDDLVYPTRDCIKNVGKVPGFIEGRDNDRNRG